MNLRIIPLIVIAAIFVVACKSEQAEVDEVEITADTLMVDSSLLLTVLQQDTTKKAHEVLEFSENLKVIEKKYGEQWGFCPCVVANDSINKAVQSLVDYESEEAERLLDRFEYVSNKCQAFLGMDSNRTPEQRAAHQKKVKNCLKNAKSN